MNRKIICALDVTDLDQAIAVTRRLAPHVGAFKIGHALTLNHGLSVIARLREVGADRVFLDLKFHDIPNSVALAVRQAARFGAWMVTLHTSGGPAMMSAAVEEARSGADEEAPLLVGVSVLTSLDETVLQRDLGVHRTLEQQMIALSGLALDSGLDGVVCSPREIAPLREAYGHRPVIVTPGIRLSGGESHDQVRTGSATQALTDGADYLVIGRALTESAEIEQALERLLASC